MSTCFQQNPANIKALSNILPYGVLLNSVGGIFVNGELLTVSQTATYLKLSEKTVRRLISEKRLQASKLGDRSWRIRSCDIDSYVKSNSNGVDLLNIDEPGTGSRQPTVANVPNENESAPRLISLFSGCGGLDCGFKKAGFNIVFANDFDSDAQSVYSLNLGIENQSSKDNFRTSC